MILMIPSLIETVDSWCAAWSTTTPGCALAIIHHGATVYARGYGMADVEAQLPMTPTTMLHVASLSKQFTALCIALIAAQGTLSLDDPVQHWLPELPASAHTVTIRHLLHHTSGLRDPYVLRQHAGQGWDGPLDQDAVFAILARQHGLNFAPGTRFEYSNVNYYLLGVLVQRVAGVSLAHFAREHIFQPLGMHHTAFAGDAEPMASARATGYYHTDTGYIPAPDATAGAIGAIGLYTTVYDLVQWNHNLDHPQVGTTALVQQLLTPGRFADGASQSYAWGLDVTAYKGLRLVHHPGLSLGISADLVRFPDQQFAVVCLCNQDAVDATTLALQIADPIFGSTHGDTGQHSPVQYAGRSRHACPLCRLLP
jgi:CubicO group peptidase (beta-lactamase class C family)